MLPEDPLLVFAPESAAGDSTEEAPGGSHTGNGYLPRIRGISRMQIALAALTFLAVAQALVIAQWWVTPAADASPGSGTLKAAAPMSLAAPTLDRVAAPAAEPRPLPIPAVKNRFGVLRIATDPPGARVSVDGDPRGVTPTVVEGLSPGTHQVTVTSSSGTVTREVTVEAGGTSALVVAMTASSEFASGWLSVSLPFTAQVRMNGTLVGSTETPRLLLPAGKAEIELVNASLGYHARRTVQITAGRTTTLELEIPRGALYVNALPWAEVWIDGRKTGETPLGNLQLPVGTHELVLRHPELGEQKRTVEVVVGAPVRIGVDLRKAGQ